MLGRQGGMRAMWGMDKVVSEERAPRSLEERRRRLVVVEIKDEKREECIGGRKRRGGRSRPTSMKYPRQRLPGPGAVPSPPGAHSQAARGPARHPPGPRSLNFTAAAGHARPLSLPTIDRR